MMGNNAIGGEKGGQVQFNGKKERVEYITELEKKKSQIHKDIVQLKITLSKKETMLTHIQRTLDTLNKDLESSKNATTVPPGRILKEKNGTTVQKKRKLDISSTNIAIESVQEIPLEEVGPLLHTRSPYQPWFKFKYPKMFISHSICPPLSVPMSIRTTNQDERLANPNNFLTDTYSNVYPAFEAIVKRILHIKDGAIRVNHGSNCSEFLQRITANLPLPFLSNVPSLIVSTDGEFLSTHIFFQESFALQREVKCLDQMNIVAELEELLESPQAKNISIIVLSHVMSNNQRTISFQEMSRVAELALKRSEALGGPIPVVFDIAQSFCNIDFDWSSIMKPHVYLIGTGLKHGRSQEGVGFIVYHRNHILPVTFNGGWCSYRSKLSTFPSVFIPSKPKPRDAQGEFLGGTVPNQDNVRLFVDTWRAIFRSGENVSSFNDYVRMLQNHFLDRIGPLRHKAVTDTQTFSDQCSKGLCLDVGPLAESVVKRLASLGYLLDSRNGRYIRIGMDIYHSMADVEMLADQIRDFLDLQSSSSTG